MSLVTILFLLILEPRAQDANDGAPDSPPISGGSDSQDVHKSPDAQPAGEVPQVLQYVEPEWPEGALEAGLEANVGLHLTVDTEGLVEQVEVVLSGGEEFDQAAVQAAMQLRFLPALQEDGEPVAQIIEFHYRFALETGTAGEEGAENEDPAPAPAPMLTGEVLIMGTREPLAAIELQLEDATGAFQSAVTDEFGQFEFKTMATGRAKIYVLHSGSGNAQTIEIREQETAEVRLWVRLEEGAMDEMIIVYEKPPAPEVTRRSIGVEEIRKVPGTFGDPVRVIQSLPGAARAPFGTGFLVIRGANPEDSSVSVDGIRVPLIYHLGGYVSIINADLIDSVDYLPGGYSTRYGRSMGGVIDVKSQEEFSEQPRLTWSTDLLDSGGLFEGRAGKQDQIGVAVAARRSYIDALIPLFTRDAEFTIKPRWYDYQLKLADLGERDHTLSLFAFGFGDTMFVHTADDQAQGTEQTGQGDIDLSYGTHRVVLKWVKPLGEGREILIQPSIGVDDSEFSLGDEWRFTVRQTYVIMRVEMPWQISPAFKITPGLDFAGGSYEVDFLLAYSPEALASSDPLAEAESWESAFNGWGWSPDPWLDVQIRPLQDREKLVLIPGLRLSTFLIDNTAWLWGLDPRFLARWEVVPGGVLKGGSGIYQQPPIGPDIGFDETNIVVDYEHAWSSEIGWEQEIGLALTADITFFYKELNDLIVENPDFDGGDDQAVFINQGEGIVQGMEVMVRRAPIDRFFGWLSYTLSKSDRRDDPGDADGWYAFDFDQTHIFTGVGGLDLPRDSSISARVQYVTGNPYTPYDMGIYDLDQDSYLGFATGQRNSERMPPYFAVDVRLDKLFTFKRWQLETYVDLLNAVHGVNPEAVRYSYDYTESTYVSGLPFILSPGIEARVHF